MGEQLKVGDVGTRRMRAVEKIREVWEDFDSQGVSLELLERIAGVGRDKDPEAAKEEMKQVLGVERVLRAWREAEPTEEVSLADPRVRRVLVRTRRGMWPLLNQIWDFEKEPDGALVFRGIVEPVRKGKEGKGVLLEEKWQPEIFGSEGPLVVSYAEEAFASSELTLEGCAEVWPVPHAVRVTAKRAEPERGAIRVGGEDWYCVLILDDPRTISPRDYGTGRIEEIRIFRSEA